MKKESGAVARKPRDAALFRAVYGIFYITQYACAKMSTVHFSTSSLKYITQPW